VNRQCKDCGCELEGNALVDGYLGLCTPCAEDNAWLAAPLTPEEQRAVDEADPDDAVPWE
jgi:hypothetical protein